MSLPNLPGGVSIFWALVYMAIGLYGLPLVLSFVARLVGRKPKESAA